MLRLICLSSLIGAIGATVSDYVYFVRILLIDRSLGAPLTFLQDVVACICASISVILSAYFFASGTLRGLTVAAVLLGILLYRLTVRCAVIKIFEALNRAIRRLIGIIAPPIAHLLLRIAKIFKPHPGHNKNKNKKKNRKENKK